MTATGGRPAAMRCAAWGAGALCFILFSAGDARAIVKGTSSSLGQYTLQLAGRGTHCSGVVISRTAIVTAAHCAGRSMRIVTGGAITISGVARSAVLDDGRRVSVSGDAAILQLASALPYSVSAAPLGAASGDSYIIAGYGTTDESARGAFGALHEARLVPAGAYALVDPYRSGSIGASACFGDSGGPVMRGSMLVGIITRAAHPSPRIACGHLTRWAPITVNGEARSIAFSSAETGAKVEAANRHSRRKARTPQTPPFRTEPMFIDTTR